VSEHPHLGRIQAVAHLSAAHALVECAAEAAGDALLYDAGGATIEHPLDVIVGRLYAAADELMEPCGVANVLQTVEEWLADGSAVPDLGAPESVRLQIVMAIVDARQAALEDEREATADVPACERGCLSWGGCDEPGEHCSATNQPSTPEGEKARGDAESLNAERLAVAHLRMHASTEGAPS
jgi:hypothetical protein